VVQARAEAGPEEIPDGRIEPGARIRVASLGQEGEVVEVQGDEALVRVGSLKVRRPLADLVALAGKPRTLARIARSRDERLAAAEEARPAPIAPPERRIDVRGLRVEELLREVDASLDRLFAAGEAECLILHGHGTGALKQALRDHLAASPYVGSFRRGGDHEGGDAVTVVTLRH
jgi:DNA mismatch repair protein MutS2